MIMIIKVFALCFKIFNVIFVFIHFFNVVFVHIDLDQNF